MVRNIYAQRGLRGALVCRHDIELGQNYSTVTDVNPNELQRKENDFGGKDVGITAARAREALVIGRRGGSPAGIRRQGTCTLQNNVKGCVADVFPLRTRCGSVCMAWSTTRGDCRPRARRHHNAYAGEGTREE